MREDVSLGGRRLAVPGLHHVLWWLLAATIAALAAAIVWALVTPVSPLGPWRPRGVEEMPAPARAALFAAIDPFDRRAAAQATQGQADAVTSLALTLYATRATPGGAGSAIIAGADGVQQVYRVGEEVQPGVKLAGVAFDSVTLDHSGAKEMLYIDQSKDAPDARAVVAEHPVMTPGETAPQGLTMEAARAGILFAPHAAGGSVAGLEVQPSGDGSAFRAAGFEHGDIVTAVEGTPVTGPADVSALAAKLKPGASVTVTVKRGGRQLPLAITLAQ
ncbi:MAG: PDZ domain-containing protein [Sphingomonadales bacterium]|nr:PDZ domain-containing protein [Sphingomonadales bacterium]